MAFKNVTPESLQDFLETIHNDMVEFKMDPKDKAEITRYMNEGDILEYLVDLVLEL